MPKTPAPEPEAPPAAVEHPLPRGRMVMHNGRIGWIARCAPLGDTFLYTIVYALDQPVTLTGTHNARANTVETILPAQVAKKVPASEVDPL